MSRKEQLRDALRIHHPIMRSETGPFSGCRCGGVELGQDVIAHVVEHLSAAIEECGAASEEFTGLGRLRCELRLGHYGPHREREDGLVWDDPWTGGPS